MQRSLYTPDYINRVLDRVEHVISSELEPIRHNGDYIIWFGSVTNKVQMTNDLFESHKSTAHYDLRCAEETVIRIRDDINKNAHSCGIPPEDRDALLCVMNRLASGLANASARIALFTRNDHGLAQKADVVIDTLHMALATKTSWMHYAEHVLEKLQPPE